MKKLFLSITLALLASLVFGGIALAVEQLDQDNSTDRFWNGGTWVWGEEVNYEPHEPHSFAGQSFTAGKTGELTKVLLRLRCAENCESLWPKSPIKVNIYSMSSTGFSLLASTTVPHSSTHSIDPLIQYAEFAPGSRAAVVAGKKYLIGVEPGPVQGRDAATKYLWGKACTSDSGDDIPCNYDTYSSGEGYTSTGFGPAVSWESNVAGDHLFSTYVDPDVVSPTGSVRINGGDATTTSRDVTLRLIATDPAPGSGVVEMKVKNENKTFAETPWEPKTATKAWRLSLGAGTKTVSVRYRDAAGNVSPTYSDSIIYRR
jgi:hypothetical protein